MVVAKESVPPAYVSIAQKYDVPAKLLYAVAMVESRRFYEGKARPWPWTLNVSGKPYFFDTKVEALNMLNREIKSGNHDIAIGIMQIFWRYHKQSFVKPGDALEPLVNVPYGAQYLRSLFVRHGDWITAVGKYYSGSSTPKGLEKAKEYTQKVAEQWAKL